MNEHSFIKSIHSKLDAKVFVWKIADRFQGGVPDAYYSGPTGYMYVEYKYQPKLPTKQETKVKINLSELQRLWLAKAKSHNHLAYIALGSPAGVYVTEDDRETWISHKDLLKKSIPRESFINGIDNVCLHKQKKLL